jgi:RimJ/RimL family protein N-acetyltransferase
MAPEITTGRLLLRDWRESDVEPLHSFYLDPQSAEIYGSAKTTRSDVWRRVGLIIGHWQLRGFGPWALEDRQSGHFAGYCGLWFPEGWGDIEIGWGIAPEFRRLGYAAEAAERVRHYGYRERGLERLVSYIDPENKASIRVAEKLGAVPDGEFLLRDKVLTVYLHTKH